MMTLRSKRVIGTVETDIVKTKMLRLDPHKAIDMAAFTASASVISDSEDTLVDAQDLENPATSIFSKETNGESENEDIEQRQFSRSATPEPDSTECLATGSDESGMSDNLSTGTSEGDNGATNHLNKLQASKAGKHRSAQVFAAMTDLKNPNIRYENRVMANALYITSVYQEEEDPWPNREGYTVLGINKSFEGAVDELVYYFDDLGEMDDIMDAFNDKHMRGVRVPAVTSDESNMRQALYQKTDEEQRDALLEMAKVGRLNPGDADWSMIVEVESGSTRHIAKVEVVEIGY